MYAGWLNFFGLVTAVSLGPNERSRKVRRMTTWQVGDKRNVYNGPNEEALALAWRFRHSPSVKINPVFTVPVDTTRSTRYASVCAVVIGLEWGPKSNSNRHDLLVKAIFSIEDHRYEVLVTYDGNLRVGDLEVTKVLR